MSEQVVWHVGYRDGWTLKTLAGRVEELDAVLVDVRRSTGRPKAAWSAQRFRALLRWRYRWLPALGNRNYSDPAAPIVLADEEQGLAELERLLTRYPTLVIMCACSDCEVCHRRVVIGKLAERCRIQPEPLPGPDPRGRLW